MNTMQQEFDAVVTHLFKQGGPASGKGGCFYRQAETGFKCAVGCRIPDDIYQADMDVAEPNVGTGLSGLIQRFGEILPKEIVMYSDMFQALQTVHDNHSYSGGVFDLERLERELKNVAHSHGVVFNKP